jgi:LacI family transcriptional regulator, repressor for deo operon, udp, cdd, tsx, nupC, and nupG
VPAHIADVARLAGVSTATVSRAMRGLPNVTEATRRRVEQAAAELDYSMSPSASRLASGTTRSIAVVAPFLGRWFFGQVLDGIEAELRQAGYDMLLFSVPDEHSRGDFFSRMPLKRRVDGVIVLTLPLQEDEELQLRRLGLPIGTVGDAMPGAQHVGIDDEAAARMATTHLLNLGHTRIATIGVGEPGASRFTVPLKRTQGFRDALTAAGVKRRPEYEAVADFTVDGGDAAMVSLMSLPQPPTAVFAQSDEMAAGALKALRRMGLNCPDDVSIIGFDNHEIADITDLTTVGQPVSEQGRIAARQLLQALEGGYDDLDPVITVDTQLIVRGSTKPPTTPHHTDATASASTDSRTPRGKRRRGGRPTGESNENG